MRPEDRDATTRAICRERCAFMGEPPCWEVGAWPNEECDEPGCAAMADAALAAVAPLVAARERERIAGSLVSAAAQVAGPSFLAGKSKSEHREAIIVANVMMRQAAAIRALGDEG